MPNDRELIEAAAEAAGIEIEWDGDQPIPFGSDCVWNPLADDGDALRLAVKLGIDIQQFVQTGMAEAWRHPHQAKAEDYMDDPYAATRRAIVRAAAAMAG